MTPDPFIYGKVPHRGDFVRAGTIGPLVDELDQWLQRAVMALRGRPVGDEPVAFVLGRPAGLLLGVLRPSQDRSGRAFPIAAGGSLPAVALTGAEIASRGAFLNAAAAAADGAIAGASLEECVTGMRVPPFRTALNDLVPADVFGGVPVEQVTRSLSGSLGPFAQAQPPKYGIGLPLPAESDRRAAGAAFWHDAVASRTPARGAVTLLWNVGAGTARLAYFGGPATADALLYLLANAPVDGIFDVDSSEATPAPPAPTLGALLTRS